MKKNRGMAYAVLAIAFILFNVIAFAVPTVKTATLKNSALLLSI